MKGKRISQLPGSEPDATPSDSLASARFPVNPDTHTPFMDPVTVQPKSMPGRTLHGASNMPNGHVERMDTHDPVCPCEIRSLETLTCENTVPDIIRARYSEMNGCETNTNYATDYNAQAQCNDTQLNQGNDSDNDSCREPVSDWPRSFKTSLTFKCLIEHLLADFSYSRPLDTYLWKQMMKMNRNITYKWCNIAKKHLLFTKRKCHKFSWLFTASRCSPRRRSICACRIACKVLVSIGL